MQESFLTYRKYYDLQVIRSIAGLLAENGIPYEIEDNSPTFNPNFAFDALAQEYRIKLRAEDFERADEVLKDTAKDRLEELPENYYLYDFKEEELMDILVKPDEWGKLDYMLAQKILNERGIEVNDKFLALLRRQRIQELSKPEHISNTWIIAAYIFAVLGGLIGILMGTGIALHQKTLPNGDRVYAYSPESRRHGWNIIFIGLLFLVLSLVIRLWMIAEEVGL